MTVCPRNRIKLSPVILDPMPRPILHKFNKDHHGFYTVGPVRTYSKLEAIEHSVRLRQPISWDYNRAVFGSVDWTQEPPGSLDLYYQQRAQQLREHYDYLVLFYSGGSDSHNALMSFVTNNIFVDEIVQWHQLEALRGDRSHNANAEQFATSIPITQTLLATNPTYRHTVHRLIDFTQYKAEIFTDQKILDRWWYVNNDFQTPHAHAITEIKNLYPAYRQLSDSGKSVAFIWGTEKPNFRVDQHNRLHCGFADISISPFVGVDRKIANNPGDHDEMFYWTPDLPELIVKQAHVVKRYIDMFEDHQADGNLVLRGDFGSPDQYGQYSDRKNLPHLVFRRGNQAYTLMRNGVRRLLYPYWDPTHLVRSVPQSRLFSDVDEAFVNSNTPFETSRRQFLKNLVHMRQWMRQHAPDYWYEYTYNPQVAPLRAGFEHFFNFYCLEKEQ